MMEKVKKGKINLIAVKDFSRFGRDYIELGDYLERIFPFLGVRFISVNDSYDSDDYKGTTGGMDVVLKNIVYDYYSNTNPLKLHKFRENLIYNRENTIRREIFSKLLEDISLFLFETSVD